MNDQLNIYSTFAHRLLPVEFSRGLNIIGLPSTVNETSIIAFPEEKGNSTLNLTLHPRVPSFPTDGHVEVEILTSEGSVRGRLISLDDKWATIRKENSVNRYRYQRISAPDINEGGPKPRPFVTYDNNGPSFRGYISFTMDSVGWIPSYRLEIDEFNPHLIRSFVYQATIFGKISSSGKVNVVSGSVQKINTHHDAAKSMAPESYMSSTSGEVELI